MFIHATHLMDANIGSNQILTLYMYNDNDNDNENFI